MRAIAAIVIVSSVGVTAARGADVPLDAARISLSQISNHYVVGERAGIIVLYDYQPGVVVRAYWQSPWRNRHYYPRTGKPPKIGRAENLLVKRVHYVPAQTFRRSWSTLSLMPEPPVIEAPLVTPSLK
jgi:hypothetical protein